MTDDFTRVFFKEIKASMIDLEQLLQNAETIYRFEGDTTLLVLNNNHRNDSEENYLVNNVENIDAILQKYTYITPPPMSYSGGSQTKVYSPNESYYFISKGPALTIYDNANDKKLVEFIPEGSNKGLVFGGWASDNRGVYFQVIHMGFRLLPGDQDRGIWKLQVPDK